MIYFTKLLMFPSSPTIPDVVTSVWPCDHWSQNFFLRIEGLLIGVTTLWPGHTSGHKHRRGPLWWRYNCATLIDLWHTGSLVYIPNLEENRLLLYGVPARVTRKASLLALIPDVRDLACTSHISIIILYIIILRHIEAVYVKLQYGIRRCYAWCVFPSHFL
jgi:hypothetical protein